MCLRSNIIRSNKFTKEQQHWGRSHVCLSQTCNRALLAWDESVGRKSPRMIYTPSSERGWGPERETRHQWRHAEMLVMGRPPHRRDKSITQENECRGIFGSLKTDDADLSSRFKTGHGKWEIFTSALSRLHHVSGVSLVDIYDILYINPDLSAPHLQLQVC